MSEPVTSIRNLGPAYEAALKKIGVTTADQVRNLGADDAYARLLQSGMKPHFIGYYVLVMGLQGRPWNDCKGEEKKALRKKFDALKNGNYDTGRGALETILNEIGVIEKPSARTDGSINEFVKPDG